MQNLKQLQMVLAKLGLYDGGLDGLWGPKTSLALNQILKRYPTTKNWNIKRQIIAGIQAGLVELEQEPGSVDGYMGHNTRNAFDAWNYKNVTGKDEVLDRNGESPVIVNKRKFDFPHQRNVSSFYGNPGSQIKSQLTRVNVPYTMRIDWNLRQKVNKITLHKKCADSAYLAFQEIHSHYGDAELKRLGLDRFAGSYNHRRMRGGKSWSMHAYACAIDFYAQPNGLRTRCPRALFCGKEYTKFFDIWEKYGWTSGGRAWGRDWMHIQAADV